MFISGKSDTNELLFLISYFCSILSVILLGYMYIQKVAFTKLFAKGESFDFSDENPKFEYAMPDTAIKFVLEHICQF